MKHKILSGLKAYLWQRISAYIFVIYFPFILLFLWTKTVHTYADLLNILTTPTFLIPTLFVIIILIVHLWVGVRDIMIDYIPYKKLYFALSVWGMFLLLVCADLVYLTILILNNSGR